MVKIYTRKGDDGTTSLWYGGRVAKTDPRTEAYGAIDEATPPSASLGPCAGASTPTWRRTSSAFSASCSWPARSSPPPRGGRSARGRCQPDHRPDGRRARGADRPLHGSGRPSSAVRDPRRDPALGRLGHRPHGSSAGRTASRRPSGCRRARLAAVLHFLNRASDLAFAMARYADETDPELFEGRRGS